MMSFTHPHVIRFGLMPIFLFLLQMLPYVGPISGGLRVGMALYVQGVVPTNADRYVTIPWVLYATTL